MHALASSEDFWRFLVGSKVLKKNHLSTPPTLYISSGDSGYLKKRNSERATTNYTYKHDPRRRPSHPANKRYLGPVSLPNHTRGEAVAVVTCY